MNIESMRLNVLLFCGCKDTNNSANTFAFAVKSIKLVKKGREPPPTSPASVIPELRSPTRSLSRPVLLIVFLTAPPLPAQQSL